MVGSTPPQISHPRHLPRRPSLSRELGDAIQRGRLGRIEFHRPFQSRKYFLHAAEILQFLGGLELLLTFFQPERICDHRMVLGLGGIEPHGEFELMERFRQSVVLSCR